ncbi:hypothetical protein EV13_2747 [Prochlorococcus sp. MIT 0702]|uniref:hypothetical protein n=1 Tax=unclassified Prochlorococcus TaxID=2627481 RepID=UPI0005339341|nr:hypothetical protein [Prochlorococcus sp. MIT 0703]KGG24825.1 hypothetical protein EV12_2697 [Prochlorococcus sp. MIT 0701]KGG25973.1 hypothetical protein EV13_2747 [Prochlorococcus sp. MIT 0702]KGG30849.1 hypothetical protein EV14_2788 [Prochlorococcus sp. MIT 0703]
MTDEETRNSQYWEERSEELSTEQLKDVSGGIASKDIQHSLKPKDGWKDKEKDGFN